MYYDDTGLKWVRPLPNIVDLESVLLYPGMCLMEATNVSVGQGTHQPFKLVGAPWLTSELVKELKNLNPPGLNFKLKRFKPRMIESMIEHPRYEDKWCLGHRHFVTEKTKVRSVELAVHLLYMVAALNADHFQFNRKTLNKLWGNDDLTLLLYGQKKLKDVLKALKKDQETFVKIRTKYLLYQ